MCWTVSTSDCRAARSSARPAEYTFHPRRHGHDTIASGSRHRPGWDSVRQRYCADRADHPQGRVGVRRQRPHDHRTPTIVVANGRIADVTTGAAGRRSGRATYDLVRADDSSGPDRYPRPPRYPLRQGRPRDEPGRNPGAIDALRSGERLRHADGRLHDRPEHRLVVGPGPARRHRTRRHAGPPPADVDPSDQREHRHAGTDSRVRATLESRRRGPRQAVRIEEHPRGWRADDDRRAGGGGVRRGEGRRAPQLGARAQSRVPSARPRTGRMHRGDPRQPGDARRTAADGGARRPTSSRTSGLFRRTISRTGAAFTVWATSTTRASRLPKEASR